MLYTANTSLQTVPVNASLNLGNTLVRECCDISHESGSTAIVFRRPGTYSIHINATAVATAAGPVTVTMQVNGVNYPGALATENITAVGNSATLAFEAAIRVAPNCPAVCSVPTSVTFISSGTATTYSNVAVTVDE